MYVERIDQVYMLHWTEAIQLYSGVDRLLLTAEAIRGQCMHTKGVRVFEAWQVDQM